MYIILRVEMALTCRQGLGFCPIINKKCYPALSVIFVKCLVFCAMSMCFPKCCVL